MRHLYQQIFATIVLVALACGALSIVAARLFDATGSLPPVVIETARYLADELPDDRRALRRELRRRGGRLGMPISLWSADGNLLGRAGPPLPAPNYDETDAYTFSTRQHIGLVLPLDDGRRLVVGHPHRPSPGLVRPLLALGLLLAFLLLGSYWAARRITRRLEALGDGVQRLGAGERNTRVQVEGSDEVAELAARFNEASERIAALLDQQARVLAGASHELRSPLARLRMALELLADGVGLSEERRARLVAECERNIGELDVLIDDILLGARLRDAGAERRFTDVDLRALVASEAERAGAEATLVDAHVQGDARALRSLLRNLLENAQRYGAAPLRVALREREGGHEITVSDGGEPIAESDRERIFEPFFRPVGTAEGQGGAGLGLALVRDIARHHGGEVRYEAPASGGSAFVVTLG